MNKKQCEIIGGLILSSNNKNVIKSRIEAIKNYDCCELYINDSCDSCNACEILEILENPEDYI